jgi:hypothetical protein
MTSPDHWDGAAGIILYASVMSRTEACEPGGRCAMMRATVEKVPHVHGNSSLSM